jgi:DHA1 family tetracycline resistance protein-like MFS transporter
MARRGLLPLMQAGTDTRRVQGRAVPFIMLTVGLDALGIGLLIPVLPRLILQLTGEGITQAAVYSGWLSATFASVQLLAGPILGAFSDRVGRRPVLLVSLAAFGCSYLLMGFASSLPWLFVAQFLTGLFGATPATAGAYIADITRPEERTAHFGMLQAAFGTGLIIGPALGGLLVAYGTAVPFFVAAGLSLCTVVYGTWALPESMRPELRRRIEWHRVHPWGALRELSRYQGIAVLCAALLMQRIAANTLPATWPYFTMQEYRWTSQSVGLSLAVFGLASVVSQVWLLRRIEARLGAQRTAALALLLLAVSYGVFAFGGSGVASALCIPLATMGFIAGPALVGMMSMSVPADRQGSLQGVAASITGLSVVVTPLLMPWLFSVFSSGAAGLHFPGAPYLLGILLAFLGVAFTLKSGCTAPPLFGPDTAALPKDSMTEVLTDDGNN